MKTPPIHVAPKTAFFAFACFLAACHAPTILPEDPAYAVKISRETAALANASASEEKVRVLVEMLEEKVEEIRNMADKGGAFLHAVSKAYSLIIGRGLSEALKQARERGEAPPDLVREVHESLKEQERTLARLVDEAADPRGIDEALAACRGFLRRRGKNRGEE